MRIPAQPPFRSLAVALLTTFGTTVSATPLHTIDSSNVAQHAAYLTPSQQILVRNGHRLPVFSATAAGSGQPAAAASPSGLQVIADHRARSRGERGHWRRGDALMLRSNGSIAGTVKMRLDRAPSASDAASVILVDTVYAPEDSTLQVGESVLLSSRADYSGTRTYLLEFMRGRGMSGSLRDPPWSLDGALKREQHDGFGSLLSDWALSFAGTAERVVPYAAARLGALTRHAEYVQGSYPNPAHTRYEKRAVFHVDGQLTSSFSHFSRFRAYVVPVSRTILMTEWYDRRGELWRVDEHHSVLDPALDATIYVASYHFDLNAKRTTVTNMAMGRPVTAHSEDSHKTLQRHGAHLNRAMQRDRAGWPLP